MLSRVGCGQGLHAVALATVILHATTSTSARAQDAASGFPPRDADIYDDHPVDRGTTGLLHALQRLGTVASLMHVTGHPDDEQAGMLTRLARGHGVRTSLLSLNRGEGGANAIGSELFDALGAIRTEELLLSGRWYGLSALYFTTAVDYGYSKTLEEALTSWSREHLLEDMVRVIRTERPLIVVSRWYGAPERDGHGHHQAAGVLTPEAVEAAADAARFPEQIQREGLRPWRALAVYRGGLRQAERADVSVETTVHAPLLGRSFQDFASEGLSLQRSQTAGRVRRSDGAVWYHYERVETSSVGSSRRPAVTGSAGADRRPPPFFDGIDTSIEGVFRLTGEEAPAGAARALDAAVAAIRRARTTLDAEAPWPIVPDLLEAWRALGEVERGAEGAPDARVLLRREMEEVTEAIRLAAGITVRAEARDDTGRPVHRVAPGQRIEVTVSATTPPTEGFGLTDIDITAPSGWVVEPAPGSSAATSGPARFLVTVGPPPSDPGPYFHRPDIRESFYTVSDSSAIHDPWRPPLLHGVATFDIGGEGLSWSAPVRGEEPDLPRGVPLRLLEVVPAASVAIEPAVRVIPRDRAAAPIDFRVTVSSLAVPLADGEVRLTVPDGWRVEPASRPASDLAPGESTDVAFSVWPGGTGDGTSTGATAEIGAVLETARGVFDRTERRIVHPDLEPRSLFTPAWATVRFVPLVARPDVRVGYVMGVGDDVPAALRELGATVDLLGDEDLGSETLSRYDVLVIGTRAYAVRPALTSANPDVLAFARAGGHVVVLYQTPEFDAASLAPHQAELPGNAEEVSEEDAPVALLDPDHPLLRSPNRISATDFEDWVEQRGSKFLTQWGPEFTPLVETHDRGQEPQRGVWLTAPVGSGHWTYVALALHRQTPYGVPGAYRILANLLSYGGT